jgi:hypothetical protein
MQEMTKNDPKTGSCKNWSNVYEKLVRVSK